MFKGKKRINNKVILYSTRNYIQHSVTNHNGKEYEKEYVCVCKYVSVTELLCRTEVINTALLISYTSVQIFLKIKK